MSYTRVALQCHKISVAAAGISSQGWKKQGPAHALPHGHPAARVSVWGALGREGVYVHMGGTHMYRNTQTPLGIS